MTEDLQTARSARRIGWIFAAVIFAAVALVAMWMLPEALRIKRSRDQRTAAALTGTEMALVASESFRGFTMGANDGEPDERPLHDVKVSTFWMDRTEVTNAQFGRFVKATGYVTTAERPPDGRLPGSWCVRIPPDAKADVRRPWAKWVPAASWLHPDGPGSGIEGRENFPVVHVSHDDAIAYAKWAGKRLPTESEWEYAVRGGNELTRYPWGPERSPSGRWPANVWQGIFPEKDEALDGFAGLAPTGSFAANAYDLQDLAGNVAEWCADWYMHDAYAQLRPVTDRAAHKNPQGPEVSADPAEPGVWKRVVRGGSWISAGTEYRCAARGKEAPQFTAQWIGFRCVKDQEK